MGAWSGSTVSMNIRDNEFDLFRVRWESSAKKITGKKLESWEHLSTTIKNEKHQNPFTFMLIPFFIKKFCNFFQQSQNQRQILSILILSGSVLIIHIFLGSRRLLTIANMKHEETIHLGNSGTPGELIVCCSTGRNYWHGFCKRGGCTKSNREPSWKEMNRGFKFTAKGGNFLGQKKVLQKDIIKSFFLT